MAADGPALSKVSPVSSLRRGHIQSWSHPKNKRRGRPEQNINSQYRSAISSKICILGPPTDISALTNTHCSNSWTEYDSSGSSRPAEGIQIDGAGSSRCRALSIQHQKSACLNSSMSLQVKMVLTGCPHSVDTQ